VFGGEDNTTCDLDSVVITGLDNLIDGETGANGDNALNSVIGAGYDNTITLRDSFLGGGDSNTISDMRSALGAGTSNTVAAYEAFIGAGSSNTITRLDGTIIETDGATDSAIAAGSGNLIHATASGEGEYGFIGGGYMNSLKGADAFIGGGAYNDALNQYDALGGGYGNEVVAKEGAIAGGESNFVTGFAGSIPGGVANEVKGTYGFAAGYGAEALNNGVFAWADDTNKATLASTKANQFIARASGGFTFYTDPQQSSGAMLPAGSGAWASLSDRHAKTAIVPLDDASILARVARLPVSEWSYKAEHGVRHLGPMAQDFYAAFGVGEDDRHITSIDEDGVALAAIKALDAENARLQAENARLQADGAAVRAHLASLTAAQARDHALVASLARTVAELRP
jgi:hypothetical protein